MKYVKLMILAAMLILILSACGKSESPEGVKKLYYPDWWRIQNSEDYVHTFGLATKKSQNVSFDAAYANAMLEAAQYVESYVKGMVKNFEEEAGVNNPQVLELTSKVVKVVSEARFTNATVTKQETILLQNNRYKTFVRASIPKDTINQNLANQIKNEEALYNQFKASQAFQELDEELNK